MVGGSATRWKSRTTCPCPGVTAARTGTTHSAPRAGSTPRWTSRTGPSSTACWTTSITIRQVGDSAFDLAFDVDGPATSLTIELCFRSGGSLTGVVPASGDGNFQLVDGEGAYTVGADTITFGPGNGSGIRQPIAMDPGEKYTYLGGSLVPAGQRVYITGLVPFRYTLRLR